MPVQLRPVQEEELELVAAQSGRTADEVAQEVMDRFLAYRRDFVAAVHEGLASAGRGELIDHEEAMAMMDEITENG
jgi:predicted transcriptional regulator